jgi:two-component system, OmpR family, sensor kinase
MKIFNSIKWRLQLWYGLILVVVLAGFGATAFQLERNRQFRRVDDELHRRVGALIQQLHGRQRGPSPGRPPADERPLPPGNADAPPFERGGGKFSLPPRITAMFDEEDTNGFYFIIRGRGGEEVAVSSNAPAAAVYFSPTGPYFSPPKGDSRPEDLPPRMIGSKREMFSITPPGETILVGKDIARETHDLKMAALRLIGSGTVILLLGLAGGWWFVGRSLRPVSEISSTATKIAAGDLSLRINTAETQSELGQLAAVLNSTFARLETAFTQQKQFAADAAHELRTPVSVILTQTQTSLNRERDAASYKQTVEACQRAAQRMRKLIESLLELARFDAGQEVLKRTGFDFSKTVSESVELVQTLAEERGVKMIPDLPPLEIVGDADRLAQVAANLLTNAIQYNRPGGEVRVKLESQNGLAVLTVADTGQGIAVENLPRVFGRFFRADQSRTGSGNAGLGLAICKAIVEAHGGTIEVASEIGKGSTFTVRLPA